MPKSDGRKHELSRSRKRAVDEPAQPIPPGQPGLVIKPPEWFDEYALDLWDEVIPVLTRHGACLPSDRSFLIQMVAAMAAAERLIEKLYEDVRDGEEGSAESKRRRTMWRDLLHQADVLAAQFGANPAARVKLGLDVLRGQSLAQHLDEALADVDAEVS